MFEIFAFYSNKSAVSFARCNDNDRRTSTRLWTTSRQFVSQRPYRLYIIPFFSVLFGDVDIALFFFVPAITLFRLVQSYQKRYSNEIYSIVPKGLPRYNIFYVLVKVPGLYSIRLRDSCPKSLLSTFLWIDNVSEARFHKLTCNKSSQKLQFLFSF